MGAIMGMGSSSKAFTWGHTYLNHQEAKMKTTFFLILIVSLMTADALPFGIPQLTKPGLKEHGKNKFVVGAAIAGAGLLTGNKGITSLGTNVAALGLKTKVAAHLFPNTAQGSHNPWGK